MRSIFTSIAGVAAILTTSGLVLPDRAQAALAVGSKAPTFVTQGAKAGRVVRFDLAQALKRGPVVLYFYPKAFTQGCTLEAHAFAEASEDFEKAGATVVGMSGDDLPTLQKFSTEACRDKFSVGIASPEIIANYDVALVRNGVQTALSDRTSYVIGRNGRITMVHSNADYREHVQRTLAAVRQLRR